ncbi:N-6 DNA methylase [Flavobacterium psychroterrae]|uniref:site-specific DNA-methyltransferase (adenine-specific) n=1 Tax=Flavobacterium psychroterrae TaxID=2133767 RepID=A0ABS5PAT3_9FLAO|nr:N-6 DNA methylase [Flavobacterium psychroterrae]MBS7230978.1 N-6 DNA methylase [Flavobacterium psychroterrae]
MLSEIFNIQNRFLSSKSQSDKKKLGQFFTSLEVSEFMASLIGPEILTKLSIKILDAGAGMGILSAAASLECLEKGIKEIHVEAYELDTKAIEYLKMTYELLVIFFMSKGATFTFRIHNLDFVLNPPYQIGSEEKFDLSVINPPYFKYNTKDSPYCKATLSLYKGNPNIYASFMALCLKSLKSNGQLIVIVPRSFTNGLYFKNFRNYMLNNSSLEMIHIFAKRNKIFKSDDVLQENIICSFVKKEQSDSIVISSSNSIADAKKSNRNIYSKNLIIDPSNEQRFIRIPESKEQFDILELAEKLPTTFSKAGYFISTGPVVEFRTREFHTTELNSAVPVIRPHNFSDSKIIWNGNHKKDIAFQLKGQFESHLVESKTYIILKRITSKDETKRLVANIYLPNKHTSIGISNKLNYLGLKNEEFSIEEATGLSSFLNSTFMDKYFRSISGNTQVNSNEIRVLKFPERKTIKLLGEKILKLNSNSQQIIDKLVLDIINSN